MVTGADILLGGIVPGILAVVTLALVWILTKNAASSWRTAAVVSFLAGLWALDSQGVGVVAAISKSVRITEAKDFLPLMMLLAVVPDSVATLGKSGALAAWLMRLALCVFLPWRMLAGSVYLPKVAPPPNFDTGAWSTGEAVVWLGGSAALLLATWSVIRAESTEQPKLRSALAALVAFAAAVTIALSGSITTGQMMGVLTATLTGCALAAWLLKLGRGPDAAAGPLVIAFGSILVFSHFIVDVKLLYTVLLVVGFAVGAGWFFPGKKWSTPLRCAICLLAIGTAVGIAGKDFRAAQAEAASNPYSNL
ncbi:MAG: hypothetical protein SH868_13485 [Bythopirellula sp.]|nr:hypothetical protein [Bythopirellula sp.]